MISTTKNAKTSFLYFVSNLGCFSMTKGTFSDFIEFYPYFSQKVFSTALANVKLGGFYVHVAQQWS
jgi:hypothetical protein